jgi:hypothetical protein
MSPAGWRTLRTVKLLTWVNGIKAFTVSGRLGQENPDSKTFVVPSIADKIVVDFDYYSIDGHSDGDQVFVGVQVYLDLDLYASSTTTVLYNDIKVTIVEEALPTSAFRPKWMKVHHQDRDPKEWYVAQGELEIGFPSK